MVPDELGRIVSLARFRVPLQMCPRIAGGWLLTARKVVLPVVVLQVIRSPAAGTRRIAAGGDTRLEGTVEGRRTAPTPLLLVIVPGPAGAPAPQRQGTGADPSGLGLGALGVGYQVSAPR